MARRKPPTPFTRRIRGHEWSIGETDKDIPGQVVLLGGYDLMGLAKQLARRRIKPCMCCV